MHRTKSASLTNFSSMGIHAFSSQFLIPKLVWSFSKPTRFAVPKGSTVELSRRKKIINRKHYFECNNIGVSTRGRLMIVWWRKRIPILSSITEDVFPSFFNHSPHAGGGPCGLACAIMLESLGWKKIRVLDRLPPPKPSQDGMWGNTDRSYNIGVSTRGRRILKALGADDRVAECSTPLLYRSSWSPGNPEVQTSAFRSGPDGRDEPTVVCYSMT
jgi:hypothetical protein